jgi:hypothetical protein
MRSFATSASESGAPDIQELDAKARQQKFLALFRQFCERVDERAASFGPWAWRHQRRACTGRESRWARRALRWSGL